MSTDTVSATVSAPATDSVPATVSAPVVQQATFPDGVRAMLRDLNASDDAFRTHVILKRIHLAYRGDRTMCLAWGWLVHLNAHPVLRDGQWVWTTDPGATGARGRPLPNRLPVEVESAPTKARAFLQAAQALAANL